MNATAILLTGVMIAGAVMFAMRPCGAPLPAVLILIGLMIGTW